MQIQVQNGWGNDNPKIQWYNLWCVWKKGDFLEWLQGFMICNKIYTKKSPIIGFQYMALKFIIKQNFKNKQHHIKTYQTSFSDPSYHWPNCSSTIHLPCEFTHILGEELSLMIRSACIINHISIWYEPKLHIVSQKSITKSKCSLRALILC